MKERDRADLRIRTGSGARLSEPSANGPLCDIQPETVGIWVHEHVGSEPPLHPSSSHLAV